MHRVRLYPTSTQAARLDFMLEVTRQTYNALLEQRRYVWTARRIAVTYKQQYAEITALRKEDRRVKAVYRECEDAALHRLDLAYAAFFRRLKGGEKAGKPRFKGSPAEGTSTLAGLKVDLSILGLGIHLYSGKPKPNTLLFKARNGSVVVYLNRQITTLAAAADQPETLIATGTRLTPLK